MVLREMSRANASPRLPACTFEHDFVSAFQSVRGTITDLFAAVGADPSLPQEVARRFRLNKNLAWKLAKIVNAADPFAAVQHLPGANGMEIVLAAFLAAGAERPQIEKARAALRTFEDMITDHVGDRATLELVLDSMGRGGDGEQLELSRKLAFRGNSGIWGLQARVRVNTAFLAPAPGDPNAVDTALIGGWVNFRRLRSIPRWAIFRVRSYSQVSGAPSRGEPVEPTADGIQGPQMIREFCSPNMPPISLTRDGDAIVYELGDGPLGNHGVFTCFFGSTVRRIGSRYASASDSHGEFFALISAPVETLLFDVLAHRDVAYATRPEVLVYANLRDDPRTRAASELLPVPSELHEIGGRPPVVATPLVARYPEIVGTVYEKMGWDAREFVGVRYVLRYPPFPSTVLLRFPLPPAPR